MADPDSSVLEDARRRARRRLVGAVVLALAAAVVLPMFLESEPKPLGSDVQIQIPSMDDGKFQNRLTPGGKSATSDKGGTSAKAGDASKAAAPDETKSPSAPVPRAGERAPAAEAVIIPGPVSAPGATASAPPGAAPPPPSAATGSATKEDKAPAPANDEHSAAKNDDRSPASTRIERTASASKDEKAVATKGERAAPAKKVEKPAPKKDDKPATASGDERTVQAKNDDNAPPAPVARPPAAPAAPATNLIGIETVNPKPAEIPQAEFVVQLGAFVDSAVARDLAEKAGAQGYPAFLESVVTKSGAVQRVRVGPFATRAAADAAAAKLKAAGFTAVARAR